MSACCLTRRDTPPEPMAAAEAIKTREQAEEPAAAPGFGASVTLASAAAWSPNPNNPPLYPRPAGQGRQGAARHRRQVGGQRAARDARASTRQPEEVLHAIAIEVGTKDTLLASNKLLDEHDRLRVVHTTRSTTAITRTRSRADREERAAVLLAQPVVRHKERQVDASPVSLRDRARPSGCRGNRVGFSSDIRSRARGSAAGYTRPTGRTSCSI